MNDETFHADDDFSALPTARMLAPATASTTPAGGRSKFELFGITAAVALQLMVLGGVLAQPLIVHATGRTIYVRVQPVDPRDLFRGDFVILSYDFSRTRHDQIRPQDMQEFQRAGLVPNRRIFVTLVPEGDGKHHRTGQFSFSRPNEGPFIAGTATASGNVNYGIESFFLQEGKGRAYENAVRSGQLSAEIVVTSSGVAALRQLHIGEPPPKKFP